ncbi:MAG: RtcB family protein, partial [Armatimonadetes bacterium]|nr:RtcB family protein [Armatimonadota bacterium]
KSRVRRELKAVRSQPHAYLAHPQLAELARLLAPRTPRQEMGPEARELRDQPVPHCVWGAALLDEQTMVQFERACWLPVAVQGAQMPDGHVGYGLPIGGVLATREAVIPYGVGVDIACRMRLTICAEPPELLSSRREPLAKALRSETRFGVGAAFSGGERRQHDVMDDPAWRSLGILRDLKERAWEQLGSSGSGNHFVEFGELRVDEVIAELGLEPGTYLALLSHSGSRGLGARVAEHYTKVAMGGCKLPDQARHLAWLTLGSSAGQEYWTAMNLAGRYAAANHELIHQHVLKAAGLRRRTHVENHHNFAWLEEHGGEQLVVHRKGATPAGPGVLGVIPGSMGDPGFLVRGRGNAASLHSASHGAGRVMSRGAAKKSLTREERSRYLAAQGVELLAGGIDESPQVYKPIAQVMEAQADLVEALAEFRPRLVLMAAGGPAED